MSGTKGILLYSGGLDSLLAARLLMDQGVEVTGFQCLLPFLPPDVDTESLASTAIARQIGLNIFFHHLDDNYLQIVKNPPHGYGKNMNPCIDCKIYFIRKAIAYMKEIGADFVATGEVVGQRPMSQMRHMLYHIADESGAPGKLVRPLSAKLLKPTDPEIEGKLDREKFLSISGRSRKAQIKLARQYEIMTYSSPAGGCLFTDPFISPRVKDLFSNHEDSNTLDMYLLTIGRHFRLSETVKIIVSRNEKENTELAKYINNLDFVLEPEFRGPIITVKGRPEDRSWSVIYSILSRYGKPDDNNNCANLYKNGVVAGRIHVSNPITDSELEKLRI